ncbi:hypothetical protein CM19_02980 [Candidatus Acidianus copahuensis]|uniref:Uncharacterized protein n=1 Tax=Candidatus Acidianus copahuensis TaxID=1160895 RepID=A0A031LUJ0_9CREN|nr:hypothetical protein [Candidatus Acidianus copahuensis]EZQ10813.1 hypothetical protein CM19_02980 [Candidatus Acidianus copahuensis]
MVGGVADRTTEALLRFGDRGKYVLKAALEVARENGNSELGDFDYKSVVIKLQQLGFDGDPKMILRAFEKDYGIIETTYKSSNQHWWKFIEIDEISKTLEPEEDPEITLIRVQANSLNMDELEKKLNFLLTKPSLSDVDKIAIKRIAFEDLVDLVNLYKRASQYEETYSIALRVKRILTLSYKVSSRINVKSNTGFHKEKGKGKDSDVDSIRLFDGENPIKK